MTLPIICLDIMRLTATKWVTDLRQSVLEGRHNIFDKPAQLFLKLLRWHTSGPVDHHLVQSWIACPRAGHTRQRNAQNHRVQTIKFLAEDCLLQLAEECEVGPAAQQHFPLVWVTMTPLHSCPIRS
jgi:hypothetical protein